MEVGLVLPAATSWAPAAITAASTLLAGGAALCVSEARERRRRLYDDAKQRRTELLSSAGEAMDALYAYQRLALPAISAAEGAYYAARSPDRDEGLVERRRNAMVEAAGAVVGAQRLVDQVVERLRLQLDDADGALSAYQDGARIVGLAVHQALMSADWAADGEVARALEEHENALYNRGRFEATRATFADAIRRARDRDPVAHRRLVRRVRRRFHGRGGLRQIPVLRRCFDWRLRRKIASLIDARPQSGDDAPLLMLELGASATGQCE
jgi:hypothetical protein